jgi:hypothetical protein
VVGGRLLALARAWFDETTVERVFEPLIADWQRECASIAGPRALLCRLQGYLAFLSTFLLTFGRDFWRPLPVGLGGAAWLCIDAFAAVGALLLVYIWHASGGPMGMVGFLLPSQLTLALPIAVAPACIVLLNSRWQPFEARRAMLRVVTITVLAMVVLTGWIAPNANQRFRESVVAVQSHSEGSVKSPVRRGMRELTLPELWASTAPREPLVHGDYGRSLELHNRLSVMLMPFCMMAVGIAASRGRRAIAVRCVAWWLVCGGVWLFAASVASARIAAGGAEEPLLAWAPTAIMLILAAVAHWISTRAPGEWTLPRWGSSISAA